MEGRLSILVLAKAEIEKRKVAPKEIDFKYLEFTEKVCMTIIIPCLYAEIKKRRKSMIF